MQTSGVVRPWERRTSASLSFPMICSAVWRFLGISLPPRLPSRTETISKILSFGLDRFWGGRSVGVVDGLGHGEEAAEAAGISGAILADSAGEPLVSMVQRCHEGLRRTRGVAMSLASFNAQDSTMTWMGVGNVEGLLLRNGAAAKRKKEYLISGSGVVGYQLPSLRHSVLSLDRGDMLVFATDGIQYDFNKDLNPANDPQTTVERILSRFAKESDDALVLAARFIGGNP